MNCTKCGNILKENDTFCLKCGAPVRKENKKPQITFNKASNITFNQKENDVSQASNIKPVNNNAASAYNISNHNAKSYKKSYKKRARKNKDWGYSILKIIFFICLILAIVSVAFAIYIDFTGPHNIQNFINNIIN